MGHEFLRREASKAGFAQKRVEVAGRASTKWVSTCAKCGTERAWGWDSNSPVTYMIQNSRRHGWSHDRRGPVCPACTEAETKEHRKVTKLETLSNPKLQRKVFNLLDDHFDEEARLYRPGWSDKKIAEAADTSEAFVESLRKGAYGELAEDPAVSSLRSAIDELEGEAKQISDSLIERLSEVEKKVAALRTRLDGYAAKRAI